MADVILDGITLNRSIQWTDRYKPTATIKQKHKRTVDGTLVIYQKSHPLGETVTLSGSGDSGWFTKDMIDSIMLVVGNIDHQMTLDFHGDTFTVMFDWSSGSPVSFEPIKSQETYIGTDWFTGEIKLIRT